MSRIPTNEEAETMAHLAVTSPDAIAARDVCVEMMRARRVESEQAEQLRQKDEQIRALADASAKVLATLRAWHKNNGEWLDCQRMLSEALRLAGRKT